MAHRLPGCGVCPLIKIRPLRGAPVRSWANFKPHLMTLEDQKEQFSFAYVRAVAAVAQVAVTKPTVDDDSIDLNFRKRGGGGVLRSPQIDAQIKCTEAATLTAHHLSFSLKIKNYEELRPADVL